MTINFNFKKYFKYFILFLLAYILLHSFSNVKAAVSLLPVNYSVDFNTNSMSFKEYINNGNVDDLNNVFVNDFDNSNFLTYYNSYKQSIATSRGYTDFNSLTADFYYFTIFRLQKNTGALNILTYLANKSTANANFGPGISVSTSSNTLTPNGYNDEFIVHIGGSYTNYGYTAQPSLSQLSSSPVVSGSSYIVVFCKYDDAYNCKASGSAYGEESNLSHLYFNGLPTNPDNPVLSLYWDTNKPNLNFNFTYLTVTWGNTDKNIFSNAYLNYNAFDNHINTDYTIDGMNPTVPLVTNFLDIATEPNIQDFDNNSYGINNNFVQVNSYYDINDKYSIICPNRRDYINGSCYFYGSDIPNFDISNNTLKHSVKFYLGDNDSIPLIAGKYYILTLRVYSPYNLSIDSLRVLSGSTNNPTNIVNVKVNDFYTYRDYQIVFTPNISGSLSANYIDIYFNDYSNLTDSLNENFSIGVYSTIKYSQFDSIPSDSDISKDYTTNNLTSISTNDDTNFFNDFKFNDRGLSSFILLPLNFISDFKNYTCSNITLPVQKLGNVELPCVSSVMNNNFPTIWNLYKIIFNGFFIYRILVHLFADIRNLYRPDNDRIEVIDL